MNGLLAIKSHMSQAFTRTGRRVPITVVRAQPNWIVQVKTTEKDGYSALQLATGTKKTKNITKPLLGHFKGTIKSEKLAPRFLRELTTEGDTAEYVVGNTIKVIDVFQAGDLVKVTGVSKGKGFAGVVKRHGFAGGPKTHGQSDRHRAPGSIGQGTTPGRVYKGKRMAGHMGAGQASVQNLTVLKVDPENNILWLSGAIPGVRENLLVIQKTGTNQNFDELHTSEIPQETQVADQETSQPETAVKPEEKEQDGGQINI